jgi:hypothetical protein
MMVIEVVAEMAMAFAILHGGFRRFWWVLS